jgi:anti-sigma regulatory factor (Ser/Thr protein kinase)
MDRELYEIGRPLDLQIAVLRCQRSTLLRGASDLERSVIGTIVSELGSNVLKYAERGTLEVRRVRQGIADVIEITVRDAGPGIADVELALVDHYSSGRTLGLGLPGVRRMADSLEIVPTAGGGTTVRVRKRLTGPATAGGSVERTGTSRTVAAGERWSAASVVRARAGHRTGGDAAIVVDRGDNVLFAIIDVSGHGPAAHALATPLVDLLRDAYTEALDPEDVAGLMRGLHEACVGTAGAAAGMAVVDVRRGRLRYLAVGNVRAAVVGARSFTGVSRDGVLGGRWPTPFVQTSHLDRDDLLLLWTDGLPEALVRDRTRRQGTRPSPLEAGDVVEIADGLVDGFAKEYDDAACLVVRWRR